MPETMTNVNDLPVRGTNSGVCSRYYHKAGAVKQTASFIQRFALVINANLTPKVMKSSDSLLGKL